MTGAVLEGVRDRSLGRPDGRIVAWSECGDEAGLPLLRVPGTPGCRYSLRVDRAPWTRRHLRVITTERPGFNAAAHALVQKGDVAGLRRLLDPLRTALLDDPVGVFRAVMDRAPAADRAVMADPQWQAELVVASKEALRQGVDGWVDEAFAIHSPWDDVDLAAVQTSVTWWHAPKDANAPWPAARRVVGQLPNARLITFGEDEGHLAGYHREGEILDELLARG